MVVNPKNKAATRKAASKQGTKRRTVSDKKKPKEEVIFGGGVKAGNASVKGQISAVTEHDEAGQFKTPGQISAVTEHDETPKVRAEAGEYKTRGKPATTAETQHEEGESQSADISTDSSTLVYEDSPSIAIPDNDPGGVTGSISVPDSGWAKKIIIQVDIIHTYIDDLAVVLVHPSGTEVVLQNRGGESTDNIIREFDSSTFPNLRPLLGQPVQGDWNLRVADLSARDVGKLERWSVAIDITNESPKVILEPEFHAIDVPIHPDDPALFDKLTRQPFADVIAQSIRLVWKEKYEEQKKKNDTGGPLSSESPGDAFVVHIHGPWGSGKTSVLNFLRENLCNADASELVQDLDLRKWVVIDFNAWRHQRVRPPWWPLIKAVYRQGVSQLWREQPGRAVLIILCEYWWNLRTSSVPYLLPFAFLLWLGALFAGNIVTESDLIQTVKPVLEVAALILGLGGLLSGVIPTLLHGSTDTAKKMMEFSRDPLRPLIHHFRNLVKHIKRPVAIFIDDLDRCEADFVVELLRGIQTMFHESNVTYIVAADREWLQACYEASFQDFKDIKEPGRSLGYLFLDKLFQVSAPLPRLSPDAQQKFLKFLVGVNQGEEIDKQERQELMREAEKDLSRTYDQTKVLEKIRGAKNNLNRQLAYRAAAARLSVSAEAKKHHAHIMQNYSHLLESNPRAMKRLVNAFAIQNAINFLSERDVPIDPLIRWTIIEMRWPELARFLESNPKMISKAGQKTFPDIIDKNMQQLFRSEALIDVVKGKNVPRSKPLDEGVLGQILGREATAG